METPTKESLMLDFKSVAEELINWYKDQSEDMFNEEIIAGKWTMAGHLYHLIKTTKGTYKGMAMPRLGLRTAFGKSNRTERTYDQQQQKYHDTLAKIAKTTGKPAVAASKYVPEKGRSFDKDELLKRFQEEMNSMNDQISKWREKDLGVYLLPHPAMGKMTIREFIYFTIIHTKHHHDNLKENYGKK